MYRGITLLSVIGNSFLHIRNNRLIERAEEYKVYVEAQGGYEGYGTAGSCFIIRSFIV